MIGLIILISVHSQSKSPVPIKLENSTLKLKITSSTLCSISSPPPSVAASGQWPASPQSPYWPSSTAVSPTVWREGWRWGAASLWVSWTMMCCRLRDDRKKFLFVRSLRRRRRSCPRVRSRRSSSGTGTPWSGGSSGSRKGGPRDWGGPGGCAGWRKRGHCRNYTVDTTLENAVATL